MSTLEGEGSLWETGTHPHRPACWLKQKKQIAMGIQRDKNTSGYRKECAEILKNKVKYWCVRVGRRPQCREIGEDSNKAGVLSYSLI